MKRQFAPFCAAWALAGVFWLASPGALPAADGLGGPYDPRLIVPTPILRRHACGADYSVPTQRGVAILSPIESPDHDCPVVGGKVRCVPYYPDYSAPSRKGPRVAFPENGQGYCCPGGGPGNAMMVEPLAGAGSSYGAYSGANQNEAVLLHMGGNAPFNPAAQPIAGPADLIDLIETGH